jgi:DNA-directed RNA polymerase subunit RPC12/RpoP
MPIACPHCTSESIELVGRSPTRTAYLCINCSKVFFVTRPKV